MIHYILLKPLQFLTAMMLIIISFILLCLYNELSIITSIILFSIGALYFVSNKQNIISTTLGKKTENQIIICGIVVNCLYFVALAFSLAFLKDVQIFSKVFIYLFEFSLVVCGFLGFYSANKLKKANYSFGFVGVMWAQLWTTLIFANIDDMSSLFFIYSMILSIISVIDIIKLKNRFYR